MRAGAGTNVVRHAEGGDDEVAFGEGETAIHGHPRVAPCPIEKREQVRPAGERDSHLTHWSSCQGVHSIRSLLSGLYGLPPAQVRVIAPDGD